MIPGEEYDDDIEQYKEDFLISQLPVHIKAQNVSDYFFREKPDWNENFEKFFCVKSPYSKCVISFDVECSMSVEGEEHYDDRILKWRAVECYVSLNKKGEYEMFERKLTEVDKDKSVIDSSSSQIVISYRVRDGELTELPIITMGFLDDRGKLLCVDETNKNYIYNLVDEDIYYSPRILDIRRSVRITAGICLATLQFMNCKNVIILDNPPTRQQVRQAERNGVPAPVTYKTLQIRPFGRARRRAAQALAENETGRRIALHIAKGHYKDFTKPESKGLGRSHARGIWWWEAQSRGTDLNRRVVKNYEVKP